MPEFDSKKQELNCKIIAGKVGISNVDDFLSSLKNIAHEYDVTIQAMDAELIAGEEHIKSAVKKAIRATEFLYIQIFKRYEKEHGFKKLQKR